MTARFVMIFCRYGSTLVFYFQVIQIQIRLLEASEWQVGHLLLWHYLVDSYVTQRTNHDGPLIKPVALDQQNTLPPRLLIYHSLPLHIQALARVQPQPHHNRLYLIETKVTLYLNV